MWFKKDIYEGLKKVSGVALVILGILGLFLPVLQGIAFIVIGLAILGDKNLASKVKNSASYIKKLILG